MPCSPFNATERGLVLFSVESAAPSWKLNQNSWWILRKLLMLKWRWRDRERECVFGRGRSRDRERHNSKVKIEGEIKLNNEWERSNGERKRDVKKRKRAKFWPVLCIKLPYKMENGSRLLGHTVEKKIESKAIGHERLFITIYIYNIEASPAERRGAISNLC